MFRRVLFLVCILSVGSAWGAGPERRVLNQGPQGFEVEVTFPDPALATVTLNGDTYARVSMAGLFSPQSPGEPELPSYGLPFGLPPGTRATYTVTVVEEHTLPGPPPLPVPHTSFEGAQTAPTAKEEYLPQEAVYGRPGLFPPRQAYLTDPDEWRFYRVQSLILNPVRSDLTRGSYRALKRVRVAVRFEPTGDAVSRPRGAPPQGRGWESLAKRVLVNGDTALRSRSGLAPSLAAAQEAPAPGVRVLVGGVGLARLSYTELAAAGLPDGISVADLRVEERAFDDAQIASGPYIINNIPRSVEDNDQDGVFGPGDYLRFYAENYWQRFSPSEPDARYTHFHAYWITDGGGAEYASIPSSQDPVEVVVPHFQSTVRAEENLTYTHIPYEGGGGLLPTHTSLFWRGPADGPLNATVPTYDPAPEGVALFSGYWRGNFVSGDYGRHYESVLLNGQILLERALFFSVSDLNWTSNAFPNEGLLNNGLNNLRIEGERLTNQGYADGSGAYFDHVEIKYDRLLKARDNALSFNSRGYTGVAQFTVTGFSGADIWVLDVTDPRDPLRIEATVEEDGGSYRVTFAQEVSGAPHEYYAVAPASVTGLPASRYELPGPREHLGILGPGAEVDLMETGRNSDYIIITHEEFLDPMERLAAHRRSRGLTTLVCTADQVYDQFAGGHKTPDAIKSFMRFAYQTWETPPTYLVLGGDANEDYRGETTQSTTDWVPTLMHSALVPGSLGVREIAGTDPWFGQALDQGEGLSSVAPDVFVGRLTINTPEEGHRLVGKIITFESLGDGAWRNRGVFQADDQYSQGITINSTYCYQALENTFNATVEEIVDRIATEGGYDDFDAVAFYQSDYLDTVAVLGRTRTPGNCPSLIDTRFYVDDNLSPELLKVLEPGGLVWAYTGHANASLMATEVILQAREETQFLNNLGRPFVFMGFACHLAEFERFLEKRGRSIGEELLTLDNRGAVAVYASTGYEYLRTNGPAQLASTAPLFWDVPRDPETGRQRRILGEALIAGMYTVFLTTPSEIQHELNRTYTLLGDPAMSMDISLPRVSVELNGEPVENGAPIVASAFGAPLSLTAEITEDVDLETLRVSRGGVAADPEEITLTHLTENSSGRQRYEMEYATTLAFGESDLVLEVEDWAGGVTRFELPASMTFSYTLDGELFVPDGDELIEEDTVLGVEILSPAPLTSDMASFALDGRPVAPQSMEEDMEGRRWRYTLADIWPQVAPEVPSPVLAITLTLGEESITRELKLRVPSDELRLENVAFYPNPLESGDGTLMYYLTNVSERVDLKVYSISGRPVMEAALAGKPGWNYFTWSGEDGLGDRVANGVYLAVLNVGSDIRHIERIVISR